MKKYRVVEDYQGGEFGMDRDYTANEWLEQMTDWQVADGCNDEDVKAEMAYWVAQNLDDVPLVFRNLKIQEKFYKLVEEYKDV